MNSGRFPFKGFAKGSDECRLVRIAQRQDMTFMFSCTYYELGLKATISFNPVFE